MSGTPLEKPCQYRATADGGRQPKPCPFCGAAAMVVDKIRNAQPGNRFRWVVRCSRLGSSHRAFTEAASKAAAVRLWNQRVEPRILVPDAELEAKIRREIGLGQ